MSGQVPNVRQKSLIAENTRLILMDKLDRNESGSKRAAIEGTNSAFKRAHGAGKLRVRGLVRCSLVMLENNCSQLPSDRSFLPRRYSSKIQKNVATRQGILAAI